MKTNLEKTALVSVVATAQIMQTVANLEVSCLYYVMRFFTLYNIHRVVLLLLLLMLDVYIKSDLS